jgi:UDP-N-acetylglucosamine--N-acetylmuramyl-(pentapeptide) pyrophosphoryl-undecaprenol N-acetylglucosamine transferase
MIMAGGTGGHVYPALAVARELLSSGHEVIWMGTRSGLEARVVVAAGIPMEWVSVSGIRGKGWRSKLAAPWMLLRACQQAFRILRAVQPKVVLGMGGFASGPGGLMARLLGIPLVLHEQNRVPGTTNRWLAKFAKVILEAFPGSFQPSAGARWTGNPLRREITDRRARSRPESESGPLRVLVMGGSLGAKALNETVPEALGLARVGIQVWHQTGEVMREETKVRYANAGIADARVDAFIEDVADAYAWADIAVCRAGAMTVSELAAVGLPAILVPFPYAIDDHQTQNARYLSDSGAAVLLAQSDLNPARLASELVSLAGHPGRLREMAEKLAVLSKPAAARAVAEACLEQATR